MDFHKLNVGDLVLWETDNDIGIVTRVAPDPSEVEPYWIQWMEDTSASGWHSPHEYLILLNSA